MIARDNQHFDQAGTQKKLIPICEILISIHRTSGVSCKNRIMIRSSRRENVL